MFASLVPSSTFDLTIVGDGIGGEPISKHLTFTFKQSVVKSEPMSNKTKFNSDPIQSHQTPQDSGFGKTYYLLASVLTFTHK